MYVYTYIYIYTYNITIIYIYIYYLNLILQIDDVSINTWDFSLPDVFLPRCRKRLWRRFSFNGDSTSQGLFALSQCSVKTDSDPDKPLCAQRMGQLLLGSGLLDGLLGLKWIIPENSRRETHQTRLQDLSKLGNLICQWEKMG